MSGSFSSMPTLSEHSQWTNGTQDDDDSDDVVEDDIPHLGASQIRFSLDANIVFEIPRYERESLFDLFYDEDEIADFRHEAFCEEIGVDPSSLDECY
jgi:hypothetical protein